MGEILTITCKLILAIVIGGCIGVEREYFGKPAGARTYALISMGAALFTIMSIQGFVGNPNVDPTRIIGQILVGIGFIGAGLIVMHKNHIQGLTTAAALWTTSALGVAVGLGWYAIAIISTVLIFILLNIIGRIDFGNKKLTLWEKFTGKQKKKAIF